MHYTFKDFQKQFPDDASCLAYIFAQRYPEDSKCPKCDRAGTYSRIAKRRAYACICGHQVNPCAGTIFHKSPTSLQSWFHAMFLMSTGKNGVSAKEIERQVGVTYKCAWRMAHQIRQLMAEDVSLFGVVEADETWVGGNQRNKHANKKTHLKNADKTPVIGLVERGGKVSAKVSDGNQAIHVLPHIIDKVKPGSLISTDESNSYNAVKRLGYGHTTVVHSAKQYVDGIAHTNTIEGFWSQLKRSINGTFHQVSPQHLQKYVNEFSYRYNRRKSAEPVFGHLLAQVAAKHGSAV